MPVVVAEQILSFTGKRGTIHVRKINEYEYEAMSVSKDGEWHRIAFIVGQWLCGCKGFAHTCRACKHIAAMKKLYSPATPPMRAPRARWRAGRRRRRIIGMPSIRCCFCRSTNFRPSFVRHNKYRNVQVYRCLAEPCKRRFTPEDGFKGRTYTPEDIRMALGDRPCCKKVRDILDSIAKNNRRPRRSTLHYWFVYYPRMVTPYLMSLDLFMSETMYTDEIIVYINGIKCVIFTTSDGGSRLLTAHQIGRNKGSHDVAPMFRMDMAVRGTVPSLVKSDGAKNFASAHERVFRYNAEGKPSMHIRHIHLDGDTNTNLKERDNDTLRDFVESCRGLKCLDTTYIGLYQIHFNVARSHTGIGGLCPMEAAGVGFEHPDKWFALIANAADYNNAVKLGEIKPAAETPPLQSGFQARLE